MRNRVGLLILALTASASATAAEAAHTYMVRLSDPPLVEHARRIAEQRGLSGVGAKAAMRSQIDSDEGVEYLRRLDSARARVLAAGENSLGRALQPRHVFRHASNGMALTLTDAEAARVATLPGVTGIHRERRERLLTDAGPQWIGADKIWNGQVSGVPKTKGEGVVIGIIDTGINPTHPSFAAHGADGFAITNPRGHFYGLCTSSQATCNAKLIGIYDFTDEGTLGVDSAGHGSHVSGIAGGNAITDALQGHTVSLQRQVSGVAPHANLIMYKACVEKSASDPQGGCDESDLVAALDQATADGVDVINYSIGGDPVDPYALLEQGDNDAAAMFQARAAGIVVVVAAGNEGPGPGSIDEPGNAPWVITAANASHNRRFANSIGSFSGAPNAPATLAGQGYTSGYGPASIVYAGAFGNALCGIGTSEGVDPTGASNPFAPGTFHGEIVICDRGTYARVEKGYNVLHAGAGGFVLANAQSDGEAIVSDDHFLPAVHLGYAEGQALKAWVEGSGTHSGTIAGVSAALDPSFGDILEASSSRGPSGFGGGVLKPDITAPGTNILSAARTGTGLALLTGTSMASPHVAGAAALLVAAHPSWTPAQIESALLGTALPNSVRKEDAVTLGTPLDAGAGRAQPADAARAGLYLPLSNADFSAQDPLNGGKPEQLNRIGIENESCLSQCSFSRTVADMSGGGTWQVSVTATNGAHVTVTPSQFTLASGASQALNIAVDVSDPHLPGTWVNGRIVLHKSTGGQSASDTALPLAVYTSPGAAPAFSGLTTSGPGDSKTIQLSGLVALPQATFTTTQLVAAQPTTMQLGVDPSPNDLYSTFPGDGKQFVLFPIVQNAIDEMSMTSRVFIAEIKSTSAPQTRLLAGVDYNGDLQPEFVEQSCEATSAPNSPARCVIDLKDAIATGATNVWALVDVPQGIAGSTYSITMSGGLPELWFMMDYGVVDPLPVVGPGHVPAGAPFSLRLATRPENDPLPVVPGQYYGAVLIDGVQQGSGSGQSGIVPFSIQFDAGGNDVANVVGPIDEWDGLIEPGETLRHAFVDLPADGTLSLSESASYPASASTPAVTFYVAKANFPAPSAAPDISSAPAASVAAGQWGYGGAFAGKSLNLPVTAGRWYIVASNPDSAERIFHAAVQYNPTSSVAHPKPGAYYNPLRAGHGIFMNDAGGNRALYWYTYLEDGTPIWYQAVAPVPDSSMPSWTAPLVRVTWDGAAVNAATTVGDVILTPINATDFMFSWHLYGASGSEHFTLLGPDQCVSFNSAQADFTGQWYAPAQSGYGVDVLALPALQNDTFYLYDSLGQPRWAAGSVDTFAADATVQLGQYSGFCPSCAYNPVTSAAIGTLSMHYASALQGSYATTLKLVPPLSGSWDINQPIARLTGKTSCTP